VDRTTPFIELVRIFMHWSLTCRRALSACYALRGNQTL
jgi:hypothetical protein